jgi:hypothetical protein
MSSAVRGLKISSWLRYATPRPLRPRWLRSRVDDVINVAGHRLGTKELESASITVEEIAEAAAVPVIDELRGKIVEMYVSLKPGFEPSKEIEQKVSDAIDREIGKIARPKNVWIVADMPKTRSGEIMRRVIAGVSNFSDVGDTTTLANPEIVEEIRHHVQSEKVARGETPRELSEQEQQEIAAFGRGGVAASGEDLQGRRAWGPGQGDSPQSTARPDDFAEVQRVAGDEMCLHWVRDQGTMGEVSRRDGDCDGDRVGFGPRGSFRACASGVRTAMP